MVEVLRAQPKTRLLCPCWCWVQPGESFLLWNKRGILQYALVRPIVSIASALLLLVGYFNEGEWDWSSGYPYAALINNVGVSISLYCLAFFYKVTRDELKPFSPVLKFTAIKMIVFFCYWQSIGISVLVALGWIPDVEGWSEGEVATNIQNLLICFEMLCFSVLHIFAFPVTRYKIQAQSQVPLVHDVKIKVNTLSAIGDSLQQNDVVKDAVDSFVPTIEKAVNTVKKEKIALEKEPDNLPPAEESKSIMKNQQAAPIQELGLRRTYEDDVQTVEEDEAARQKEREQLPEDITSLSAVNSKN